MIFFIQYSLYPIFSVSNILFLQYSPILSIQYYLILSGVNKGVPKLGNPVSRGDHRITVKISIPTRVTGEERELLEKLAKVRGETVGKGGIEGFLGNIFHK